MRNNFPHAYLANSEASFDYNMMNKAATEIAFVTVIDDQIINAKVTFEKKNGYELTASLMTPYTEDYSLSVSHTGDKKSFENTATVQWSAADKITTVTTVNTRYDTTLKYYYAQEHYLTC